MYLARLAPGRPPVVTQVADDEGYLRAGKIILRARRPWARKTKDGAAALSQSRAGAIASARAVMSQAVPVRLEPKQKYQRAHIA